MARTTKSSAAKQTSRRRISATVTKSTGRRKKSSSRLRGDELKRAVKKLQNEPDDKIARQQWKRIEQSIFGVRYEN
ncbi:MAG: hypothetical protein DMG61_05245 [Acidobacteria bacterium]|nr:MAG: hypothetical protein DMG61_05245 [Acidobacteriota bacterium]